MLQAYCLNNLSSHVEWVFAILMTSFTFVATLIFFQDFNYRSAVSQQYLFLNLLIPKIFSVSKN